MTHPFGESISMYTRRAAISDGVLIDVSTMAREAGFRVPVALTAAAWEDCVRWDQADSNRQLHQDQAGRLWDVVWMASVAARRNRGSEVNLELYRVPRGGKATAPRKVRLVMSIGPGDEGEPVITVLMPGED
ncbi:hypothetical protein F7Q92_13065 [Ideonella dechloratans]|uniref:Uncharacterized protein n=1 Tax=Ideonella dechloratans TaxID=36863 RepID=A0A643FAD7_IDEDE|nr:DUF6573 family protein [Ideonella dechloratans]KAB0580712.1 hypothetical protein F7Q92_13065 [Ideonella dechloratans]UFU09918.1 hypothetical protein LRM40_16725 [Ideonella dechloratans]